MENANFWLVGSIFLLLTAIFYTISALELFDKMEKMQLKLKNQDVGSGNEKYMELQELKIKITQKVRRGNILGYIGVGMFGAFLILTEFY